MNKKIKTIYIKKREMGIWICPKCYTENIDPYPETIKIMARIWCSYCHFDTNNFEFEKEE